jgi:uncharacterized protein YacL (UPF0231 family)
MATIKQCKIICQAVVGSHHHVVGASAFESEAQAAARQLQLVTKANKKLNWYQRHNPGAATQIWSFMQQNERIIREKSEYKCAVARIKEQARG